jgi:hypothetical protein
MARRPRAQQIDTMQRTHKGWKITAVAVALGLPVSCARFEESGLPGSASSMAHNQIMVVKAEPATFGHYRLSSQMRIYPDLALFVEKRGLPDFLAETSSGSQHYLILYYLKARQAYAARTRPSQPHGLEFAGPYPITDREKRILSGLRKKEPE